MIILSLHTTQAQVCTFAGAECCGEGITNFQLNGSPAINRTSTVNENFGFTNTGLTTTVTKGQTYNFSVTFPVENNVVNCNTYNFKIYVDYNQNNVLSDAGEEVAFLTNVATGTRTGSFTIPTTALVGNAYMRVMMKMAATSLSGGFCGHSALTPCNIPADPIGFHGEVENYTLKIMGGSGIENNSGAKVLDIFPNPSNGKFTLQLPESIYNGTIDIYSVLGEKIFNQPLSVSGKEEINLTNISPGIYFLMVYDGEKYYRRKISIE